MAAVSDSLEIDGARITTCVWGASVPSIVMLHDGLGSIAQWGAVPERVAQQTGATVLAYDRPGHGASLPVPTGPWPTQWLRSEAATFDSLLRTLNIERPFVVGHSDGGSIALLHASQVGDGVAGVLTMAPHSWVEEVCYDAIVGMRAKRAGIVAGLARHHDAPGPLFEAWSGAWVSDEFRRWDIRPELGAITAPVTVSQGRDDAYASPEHAIVTAEAIGDNGEYRLLDGLGHLMHYDDPDRVVDLIVDSWRSIGG